MIPCFRQTTKTSYDRNCRQPEARIGNVPRPGNYIGRNLIYDPWFGLKSLVIPDPILLSPEPFPLSPDPSHILGFEP